MRRGKRIAVALLIVVASVGIGYAATSSYVLTSETHLDASDGPEVVLGDDYDLEATQPFPDGNTVDLSPYGTLSSDGSTEVRVETVGETVVLDDLDVSQTELEADLSQNRVGVEGEFTSIEYRDELDAVTADEVDGWDIRYSSTGDISLTIEGLSTNENIIAVDESREPVDEAHTGDNGAATFEDLPDGSNEITLELAPSELEIRDERTQELIDGENSSVEVRFFAADPDTDQVVTRETTDGTINLEGLPATEEFVATADVEGYESRRIVIDSIYDQSTIYMLNQSATSALITFDINDRTEDFSSQDTKLRVEKALGNEEIGEYEVIAGDYLGAGGEFPVTLDRGDRYRISVENREGQSRALGSFVAETDDFITLDIGQVVIDPGDDENWIFRATTEEIDEESEQRQAVIEFRDQAAETDHLEYRIVDVRNESNVLHGPVEIQGPVENHRETVELPEDNETNWAVEYSVTRDGEIIEDSIPIGGVGPWDWPISGMWLTAFGLFAIIGTASLFGGAMSRTGAVVISVLAFALTTFGVLTIPYPMLILAGVVSVVFKFAEQSDQGGFI